MHEGFYTKPKYPIPLEPKIYGKSSTRIAVVIPAYIPAGQNKNYGHYVENKLETIKMNLAAHKHYEAGMPYDIILFDNSSPDPEGAEWLAKNGALLRENSGYGFGAWKEAWQLFGEGYDFFLFTEDDIAPSKDGWLIDILRVFLSDDAIGAVGNFVEGRSSEETMSDQLWDLMSHQHDMMYNFDGAFTFTSSEILHEVDAVGGLPVFPCAPDGPYPATVNECVFQQPILQLGYKITSFDDGEHCVIHGSEIFTGDICNRDKPLGPLVNVNGIRKIPKVAEHYAWYKSEHEHP